MIDHLTPGKRSWNMKRIKSKNSLCEIQVRKYLFNKGLRYRLHVNYLPGKPDIVMPKHRSVIFVNGCFWHRHKNCQYASIPKSNINYWRKKFLINVIRDKSNYLELNKMGWKVYIIWECEINDSKRLESVYWRIIND